MGSKHSDKNAEVIESQGSLEASSGTPFQMTPTTSTETYKEARTAFRTHENTKEQEPSDDEELLKFAHVGSVTVQELDFSSNVNASEKPREGTEIAEESVHPQDFTTASTSRSQETERTNNGENQEPCSTSTSRPEFNTACKLFSVVPSVAKSGALLSGNELRNKYGNKTEKKYENNCGKNVEQRSVSSESSAVDPLDQHVRGPESTSQRNPEVGSTSNMTESATSFPAASCSEREVQPSCFGLYKAESGGTARTHGLEMKLKYLRKMRQNRKAKVQEHDQSEADQRIEFASRQRQDAKSCQKEKIGSSLEEATKYGQKGNKTVGACRRIVKERKQDEWKGASPVPLGNEGSAIGTTGPFRQQSHSNVSKITYFRSQSACLNAEPQHKHEAQYPLSGEKERKSASSLEKKSSQLGHQRIDTKQTHPYQNRADVHLKPGSFHQGQESGNPSFKALPGPSLSKASLGSLDRSGAPLQSAVDSLPVASITQKFLDHIRTCANCAIRARSCAQRQKLLKLIRYTNMLASQDCHRESWARGFFETTKRQS